VGKIVIIRNGKEVYRKPASAVIRWTPDEKVLVRESFLKLPEGKSIAGRVFEAQKVLPEARRRE